MKRINLAMVFVLFFGLVAASCASVTKDIRVDGAHDPKVNFSALKTYAFVGGIGALFDAHGQWAPSELDVATEVALKAGAGTLLAGNLMRLDERWIITCQLVDVAQGTVAQSHRIDGADLYTMVDELSDHVRQGLTLEQRGKDGGAGSVREKTTGSMEAYRHYLAGVDCEFPECACRNIPVPDNCGQQQHYG